MRTWRERIAAWREAGGFPDIETRVAYTDRRTCLAAEVAGQYGVEFNRDWKGTEYSDACVSRPGWFVLWDIGDEAATGFSFNRPELVEHVLERIEDLALALKRREQSA